jgi:hypothetical protein
MIDHNNPLLVSLPYNFNNATEFPTEVMANRIQAWRSIIKDLVNYLKEYASVQEEIVRQQQRLQQAVGSPKLSSSTAINMTNSKEAKEELVEINKFFLPIGNGSIQDLPSILTKYHQQNVVTCSKTLKEINNVMIPKLEELRKDLLVKIKEIKNLQNDFKTNLGKELAETRHLMSQYSQAIELSNKLESSSSHHVENDHNNGKRDPYLVKLKLDRQLKKQISEEHYLYEAYANLQNSGGKLESIVVLEIQNYLSNFLNLINNEYSSLTNFLLPNFNNGFLSKESNFEWDSFISRNLQTLIVSPLGNSTSSIKPGTFIDLSFASRKFNDLSIPNYNTSLNIPIREGFLERRSKYLKNYSSGWYVLTCNFIHEFKSSDRKKDPQPSMSLPLDTCVVTEHSKDDGKAAGVYKFILSSKLSNGLIHRTHNWVFRTDTYPNMIDWYNDIKNLTNLPTPASRARFIDKKLMDPNAVASKRPNSKHVSGTSSIYSNTTGKSLQTFNTNASPSKNVARLRPLSQATSIVNAHRLSASFSQKNNQSPRLSNMINSDGTIITPVESFVEDRTIDPSQATYSSPDHPDQGLSNQLNEMSIQQTPVHGEKQSDNSQPIQRDGYKIETSVHYPQDPSQPLHATPQQVAPQQPLPQGPVLVPGQQFIQGNYQYYVPPQSQQAQQFYDPVQQQYFTLTPSVAQQGAAQPQPQYFPPSPQPGAQPQFANVPAQPSSPGAPPFSVASGNYFPQYVAPQQKPVYGENLPYPTNLHPVVSISGGDLVVSQTGANGSTISATNDTTPGSQADVNDEVTTLQSNGGVVTIGDEEDTKVNGTEDK